MVTDTIKIVNPHGLHMRPAYVFVETAQRFSCSVTFAFGGKSFDAKGIFQVLTAGVHQGDEIVLCCDGVDEGEALAALKAAAASGLGE